MKRIKLGAIALFVFAVSSGGASAATHPAGTILSTEQAWAKTSKAVSKSLNISQEKAESILNIESRSAAIIEGIRERYKSRLAGLYIEHDPAHRIVVRLTGKDTVQVENYQFGADNLRIEYLSDAEHTISEMVAELKRLLNDPGTSSKLGKLAGGYVDEKTGQIVIGVEPDSLNSARAAIQVPDNSLTSFPFRIEARERAAKHANIYGSGKLTVAGCTTAFAVNHSASGLHGILTAGHCANPSGFDNYVGLDGQTATLGQQAVLNTAYTDLMWYTGGPSDAFGPYVYDGSAWVGITGRRSKAATSVGQTFCLYGQADGYSCGTISAVNDVIPGSICGPGEDEPCDPTYVRVSGSGLKCASGNSGGPWTTLGTLAAGVHTAGPATPHTVGGDCWYSSTDDAYSYLGLNLLYAP